MSARTMGIEWRISLVPSAKSAEISKAEQQS
jgi:hypothetical protein